MKGMARDGHFGETGVSRATTTQARACWHLFKQLFRQIADHTFLLIRVNTPPFSAGDISTKARLHAGYNATTGFQKQ
jgi:hypothetical protein